MSDIKTLSESKKNYYKSVKVVNTYSKNYKKYESNGDENKTLSIKDYLDEIKSYLKDIINNPKKSVRFKTQLMIAINLMFSIDIIEEEHVMHSRGDNIQFVTDNETDETINELFILLNIN